MLGVVLWSDATDRKAVIWCEDQGDLAYVNGKEHDLIQGDFFDAGDLVQFDMHVLNAMRHAHNPRLVVEQASSCLPTVLRNSSRREPDRASTSADIIPFARHQPAAFCAG